jgi:hypothetical protein
VPFAIRETIGIFHRSENLQGAIDELLGSGFDRAKLSLLASESAVQEKLGHRYEKVNVLADDPTVPRSAYASTEAIGGAEGGLIGGLVYVGAMVAAGAVVASGGTLTAVIAAAGLAGGAGRRGRRSHWLGSGQMGWRSPCPLSATADRPRRGIVVGAGVEHRRRGTCHRNS